MYDLIGDIHGHAAELESLLRRMDYRERAGAWRHPERTAIFVGDFLDRGPEIRATLRLVRAMLEAGSARSVRRWLVLCTRHGVAWSCATGSGSRRARRC